MVNWMVAVDGSEYGSLAFKTAIRLMNKEKDHLLLSAVVEDIVSSSLVGEPPVFGSINVMMDAQNKIKREAVARLKAYGSRAHEAGVQNVEAILGHSANIGKMICRMAEERNTDILVMGRRGMGRLDRFFVGSVSKHCVENANCSVIVVKMALDAHAPAPRAVPMPKEAMPEETPAEIKKFHGDLDRHIALMAEEEERIRRMHEQGEEERDKDIAHKLTNAFEKGYLQSHPGGAFGMDKEETRALEEAERERRMKDQGHDIDIARQVTRSVKEEYLSSSGMTVEMVNQAEEQERERRMKDQAHDKDIAKKVTGAFVQGFYHQDKEEKARLAKIEEEERQRRVGDKSEQQHNKQIAQQMTTAFKQGYLQKSDSEKKAIINPEERERNRRMADTKGQLHDQGIANKLTEAYQEYWQRQGGAPGVPKQATSEQKPSSKMPAASIPVRAGGATFISQGKGYHKDVEKLHEQFMPVQLQRGQTKPQSRTQQPQQRMPAMTTSSRSEMPTSH